VKLGPRYPLTLKDLALALLASIVYTAFFVFALSVMLSLVGALRLWGGW
jgi:hypothetical protein